MRLALLFMFLTNVTVSSVLYAKVSIDSVNGSIPRGATSYFDLQVTLNGIETAKTGSERYAHRLNVYIKQVSSNLPIPFSDKDTSSSSNVKNFVIEFPQDEVTTLGDDKLSSAKIYLRLRSGRLSEVLGNNNYLTLDIDYKGAANEQDAERKDIRIEREKGVANQSPTGVIVEGSFGTIYASYDSVTSIPYTSGPAKAPTGALMFAVERNQGSVTVDALVHDANADTDTEKTKCVINPNVDDGEICVSCDKEPAYFDLASLPNTVKYKQGNTNAKIAISGLAIGTDDAPAPQYTSFLTFQPSGVKRSTCYMASPQRNTTWAELVDDSLDPKLKDARCFIATAAYGSPFADKVQAFRDFRDQYLLTSPGGRFAVKLYYIASPPLARLIEKSPTLKKIAINTLDFIYYFIK